MTTYFVNHFKGYYYGDNLAAVTENIASRQRLATPANRRGRYSAGSLRDYVQLTLEGTLQATDPEDMDAFRAEWDAFKAAHDFGVAGNLYLDDDRYLFVEVTGNIQAEKSKGLTYRNWSVTLTSYDPYWYSNVSITLSSLTTNNSGNTVTTAGNAPAFPIITFVTTSHSLVAGAPNVLSIVDNSGTIMNISALRTGTYVVDCLNEKITCDGVNVFSESFDGEFVSLSPGANSFRVNYAIATGTGLSSFVVSYRDRWS